MTRGIAGNEHPIDTCERVVSQTLSTELRRRQEAPTDEVVSRAMVRSPGSSKKKEGLSDFLSSKINGSYYFKDNQEHIFDQALLIWWLTALSIETCKTLGRRRTKTQNKQERTIVACEQPTHDQLTLNHPTDLLFLILTANGLIVEKTLFADVTLQPAESVQLLLSASTDCQDRAETNKSLGFSSVTARRYSGFTVDSQLCYTSCEDPKNNLDSTHVKSPDMRMAVLDIDTLEMTRLEKPNGQHREALAEAHRSNTNPGQYHSRSLVWSSITTMLRLPHMRLLPQTIMATEAAVVLRNVTSNSSKLAVADRYLLLEVDDEEKMHVQNAPHDEGTPMIKTHSLTFFKARARLEKERQRLHAVPQG
ncbi:hypothetical protein BDR22DRAFT_901262 [Usnea florida]